MVQNALIPKFLNVEIDEKNTVYILAQDGTRLGKKPASSLYVDQCFWIYQDLTSIPEEFNDQDLDKHMWAVPSPPWHLDVFDEQQFDMFVKGIEKLYRETDYSIVLSVGCNMFETGTFLRGMANFMIDMYTDKKNTMHLLDTLVERNLIKLEKVIDGVGEYVDLLQFGDDLGGQDSPFMSPEVYDEVFKPRHKKMWDFVHKKSNCKIFLHSCGSIYKLLPGLIEAGLDVLNPVQTTAKDMEPEKLKKEFGKDIIFWAAGAIPGMCWPKEPLTR
ncbi:MAG: uroporphyrinogen decarboxylase family protein [Actinomycetota bacterium]|nr:uroporphyrinogen decarboxylase family protein [Actinomycetota bacterium]